MGGVPRTTLWDVGLLEVDTKLDMGTGLEIAPEKLEVKYARDTTDAIVGMYKVCRTLCKDRTALRSEQTTEFSYLVFSGPPPMVQHI